MVGEEERKGERWRMDAAERAILQNVRKKMENGLAFLPWSLIQDEARRRGISAQTLKRRVYEHPACPDMPHGNCKLSDIDELVLTSVLYTLSVQKRGLRRREVLQLANDAFGVQLGRKWLRNYLSRYASVPRVRKGKVVKKGRVDPARYEDAEDFCDVFGSMVRNKAVSEKTLHNLGEIRFIVERPRLLSRDMRALGQARGAILRLQVRPLLLQHFRA